jgi:hypothetical protein
MPRTNVLRAAVQNRLIAPAPFTEVRERLDDPEAQLLALLVLVYCDVFNVTNSAQTTKELALDKKRTRADNDVGLTVDNHQTIVGMRCGAQVLKLPTPRVSTRVSDDCEDGEYVQMATMIIRRGKRANLRGKAERLSMLYTCQKAR